MIITRRQLRQIIREAVESSSFPPRSWFSKLAAERGYGALPIGADFGEGGWQIADNVYAAELGDFNPLTGEDDRVYVWAMEPDAPDSEFDEDLYDPEAMVDHDLGYADSVEDLDNILTGLGAD
jgi:hypothetical protein